MSKIKLIGKNIRFVALNRIVTILVSLIIFPFIVNHVGKVIYGVYLMVMTVTGYFGLLDFGVMSALTKYVSEYSGRQDNRGIDRVINASFSFYVLIGTIIALLLFVCALYFTTFFKIDMSLVKVVRQLFIVAAFSSLLVWPLATFRGTIQGLNLWNIDATVNLLTQIINAFATFIILSSHQGIVQLFIAGQTLTILSSIVLYFIAKKRIGFKISFPYLEINTFKFIFKFSVFMFLTSLVSVFLFQIHNILIGYFISMSAVAVYAVAFNIQNYFRLINGTLGVSPWITASQMQGEGDSEGQKKLLFKGTKYMSAVFLPMVLIMFFFAEPFITYWMGAGFKESIIPARIIILFWLFNGTLELAGTMVVAKAMVKQLFFINLAIAVVNILIGISLIKILGITALALGLTLSMILVGFPLILRLSLRSLKVSIDDYLNKSIRANLPLYFLVVLLSVCLTKYLYPKNIYATLFEMGIIYSISLLMYYSFILDRRERQEIRELAGAKIRRF